MESEVQGCLEYGKIIIYYHKRLEHQHLLFKVYKMKHVNFYKQTELIINQQGNNR